MMAAEKKKPEDKNTDTLSSTSSLRDDAETQLARSQKHSPELKGHTHEQLIHELQVHQIELENQAEELRKSKNALEESRDKYLDLYDFAPTGYFTLNDKALIVDVNLTGATLIGVERSKLFNARFRKFISQNDNEQWIEYFMGVLNREEKQICTLVLTRGDGSTFPARLESIRITNSSKVTPTVRVAISNITDIRQVEEALKDSEERYRLMNDASLDFIYSYDRSGRFTSANRSLCVALNLRANQIIGRTYTELGFPDAQCRDWEELHKRVYKTGTNVTAFTSTPMPDGTIRQYEVVLNPLHDSTGAIIGITGTTRDITERKQQELALLKNSEELHTTNDELAAAGEELKSQFDALADSERMIRLSEERLVIAEEIGHTGCWEYNYNLVNNNSWASAELLHIFGFPPVPGNFPIETFEACIPERERVHKAMIDLIRAEKDYNLEFAINPADGSAPKMIHSIARLEKDAMGNPLRILGVAKDITERKLAESTLQRVNQKLNVLSQLTRQDLTTQIFVLNSYLEMAKTHATGQDGIIKNIESSERAVRSIKEIMEFTKDYQNMGEKPPKYQNVKLSFLFGLSHISIGEIQHSLETENLEIFADPLLEKAFQGMLENSVKHGGHVSHIRVSHTITPDSVTIVFEDDGVGIPKEKKERIFLRGEGARASVRGLVFVREILDITSITITETGEPGKGARFEMTVPKGAWRIAGNGA